MLIYIFRYFQILRLKKVVVLRHCEANKCIKTILDHIATMDVYSEYSWSGKASIDSKGNSLYCLFLLNFHKLHFAIFFLLDKTKKEFVTMVGVHKLLFELCDFSPETVLASIKSFLKRVPQIVKRLNT